jgi:hypothetical protein
MEDDNINKDTDKDYKGTKSVNTPGIEIGL